MCCCVWIHKVLVDMCAEFYSQRDVISHIHEMPIVYGSVYPTMAKHCTHQLGIILYCALLHILVPHSGRILCVSVLRRQSTLTGTVSMVRTKPPAPGRGLVNNVLTVSLHTIYWIFTSDQRRVSRGKSSANLLAFLMIKSLAVIGHGM